MFLLFFYFFSFQKKERLQKVCVKQNTTKPVCTIRSTINSSLHAPSKTLCLSCSYLSSILAISEFQTCPGLCLWSHTTVDIDDNYSVEHRKHDITALVQGCFNATQIFTPTLIIKFGNLLKYTNYNSWTINQKTHLHL